MPPHRPIMVHLRSMRGRRRVRVRALGAGRFPKRWVFPGVLVLLLFDLAGWSVVGWSFGISVYKVGGGVGL
jgi:hypothetical protein